MTVEWDYRMPEGTGGTVTFPETQDKTDVSRHIYATHGEYPASLEEVSELGAHPSGYKGTTHGWRYRG